MTLSCQPCRHLPPQPHGSFPRSHWRCITSGGWFGLLGFVSSIRHSFMNASCWQLLCCRFTRQLGIYLLKKRFIFKIFISLPVKAFQLHSVTASFSKGGAFTSCAHLCQQAFWLSAKHLSDLMEGLEGKALELYHLWSLRASILSSAASFIYFCSASLFSGLPETLKINAFSTKTVCSNEELDLT